MASSALLAASSPCDGATFPLRTGAACSLSVPRAHCSQGVAPCGAVRAQRGVPLTLGGRLPGPTLRFRAGEHLGLQLTLSITRKGPLPRPGLGVVPAPGRATASLFGVGAPEALVIGVVALIVFGPKGLAEVARNLGKTLRTFQPTIKELQEVTREFRDTLQQEIGLDELRPGVPPRASVLPPSPVAPASTSAQEAATASKREAYSADEYAKVTEEQMQRALEQQTVSEEARRASELAAWKGSPPSVPKGTGESAGHQGDTASPGRSQTKQASPQ